MGDYAVISGGVVVQVVVADPTWAAAHLSGAIDIDTVTPRPGIGWAFDGTNWTAPAAPPPTGSLFTTIQFMNLFTTPELQAIINYASNITLTSQQKQQVAIFMQYFNAATSAGVDMLMAPTIAGVELLEACGLINTGRAAIILATRH